MKKNFILLFLAIALLSSGSGVATAATPDNFEIVGGITYNTFKLEQFKNGEQQELYKDPDDVDKYKAEAGHGIGFYLGGRYWFTPNWGLELGVDRAKSIYQGPWLGSRAPLTYYVPEQYVDKSLQKKSTETLIAPYSSLTYQLNKFIRLQAGIAYYYGQENTTIKHDGETLFGKQTMGKFEGTGYLLSGKFNYPLQENLQLTADLGYRFVTMKATKRYDFRNEVENKELITPESDFELDGSGLRTGLGLTYQF